jgi:hypothetical protein
MSTWFGRFSNTSSPEVISPVFVRVGTELGSSQDGGAVLGVVVDEVASLDVGVERGGLSHRGIELGDAVDVVVSLPRQRDRQRRDEVMEDLALVASGRDGADPWSDGDGRARGLRALGRRAAGSCARSGRVGREPVPVPVAGSPSLVDAHAASADTAAAVARRPRVFFVRVRRGHVSESGRHVRWQGGVGTADRAS